MSLTVFVNEYRSSIMKAKLKLSKNIKSNLFAYETKKYKESLFAFDVCLNTINSVERKYNCLDQLSSEYIIAFYYEFCFEINKKIDKYIQSPKKYFFKFLNRKCWGYVNTLKTCLSCLKKQLKAYID